MTAQHTSPLSSFYKWVFDPEFKHGFHQQVERTIAFLIVAIKMNKMKKTQE